MRLAAIAEYRQTHPIARAIQNAAAARGLICDVPDEVDYSLGFGLRVNYQDHVLHVGSLRFMVQQNITIPSLLEDAQTWCATQDGSLVMVAVDGQLAGAVELQTQLRPEAQSLVAQLHARGLKLAILSGDHAAPTRHLAARLGIDEYYAEVLPEAKAEQIKALQASGRVVCFVGDGINDAIALQQADVSVSMRGATTIATDSAQVVLSGGSLQQLADLFELSHAFKRDLNTTLRFAYIPGSILIAGVFLFHFGMGSALILYSAGLVGAIYSALRPMRQLKHEEKEKQSDLD
ncbi:hypothetical protein TPSD3_00825 [Thioflexithrix psekupsensis]|uniref:Heavy metal translocating P-type ATPase n=1 Tax=Thioflexithrix psekupsensis TaxID=1570016 RepID=A0A251XC41_9GAMM|nr:HAD-IC family P-type ATPase [Thioflexithrix psekupsensis]OUD16297.1 hypothetical protein TPSD3_00825 [Thioflexithrix psekupsensis]